MSPDEPPALTRRSRRERREEASAPSGATLTVDDTGARADDDMPHDAPVEPVAEADRAADDPIEPQTDHRSAFLWVDPEVVARTPAPIVDPDQVAPDLLERPPRRSPFRPSVLVPTALVGLVAGAYAATTLLWPLHEVAPEIEAIGVQTVAAAAAAPPWPETGAASIAVRGIPGDLASGVDAQSIASITKVVTALAVLDEMPLAPGEAGPEYRFSSWDSTMYWQYRARGESALDVPVGGSLSQYQMLEGMLIGSANNYADRLATTLWPTDAVYASAANGWLSAHGIDGVTVVEPTGLDQGNIASPSALIALAEIALANPVIAEIVAKPSVDLPGAGFVENTNGLLADPGVIGIKTGTLDTWNLLSAKEIVIGETTVRMYASVLGQPDNDARLAASRALYAQTEAELQPQPSVAEGTTVGYVTTAWGEDVAIETDADASVVLWNGGSGTVSTDFALGDARERGADVGSLSVVGPLDESTVALQLADDIEEPSPWWRLTHPLELFGLND
ncbi:D-alanyl-D-alanine carboxypeptidase family protein [Microbacterium koreense]|uniref:D-alanyl-D-alanine carboxypeptidase family protein n=1 Tax=Microbacterium koreense TaxID=323761 RepID=A0ABW2ZN13_9MICO